MKRETPNEWETRLMVQAHLQRMGISAPGLMVRHHDKEWQAVILNGKVLFMYNPHTGNARAIDGALYSKSQGVIIAPGGERTPAELPDMLKYVFMHTCE